MGYFLFFLGKTNLNEGFHTTLKRVHISLSIFPQGGGGGGRGQLVDFYDGGDHVHIWGLKFRKDEHIWGLRF